MFIQDLSKHYVTEIYCFRNAKLVLILGDRGLNSLDEFATNEAIQATEIFEYAQKLSNPDHMMVNLQYFK